MKKFSLFLFVLLPLVFSHSVVNAPAVGANGQGVLTQIVCDSVPGNGTVFVSVSPLVSEQTQKSAENAVEAVENYIKRTPDKNFLLEIKSDATSVDGPSGGAAMALLIYNELENKTIRPDFGVTGAIDRDGRIGTVGGIIEKMQAVKNRAILFAIPTGESAQEGIDLVEYGKEKFGLQVVEVSNFSELLKLAYSKKGSKVSAPKNAFKPLVLEKASYSEKSLPMRYIASRVINDTIVLISEQNASSDFVAAAQKSINESQYLLERGYFYSAANRAFLTKISIETYSQLNISEKDFWEKMNEEKALADSIKFSKMNSNNWEWVAGAKLRYQWALSKLALIESNKGVPIISMLKTLVSAHEWLLAAKEMNKVASKIPGAPVDESLLYSQAANEIQRASALQGIDSDADWHLSNARSFLSRSDYAPAIYEAAFAYSFAKASNFSNNKTFNEIKTSLKKEANFSSVWAELYYINSIYTDAEAERSNSLSFMESTLDLRYLSEELEKNYKDISFSFSHPSKIKSPAPTSQMHISISTTPPSKTLTFISIIAVVLIIFLLIVAISAHRRSLHSNKSIEELGKELDERFLKNEISEKNYEYLKKKFFGYGAKKIKAGKRIDRKSRKKPKRKK